MTATATTHPWMARMARRSSSSSVARVALPRFAPCVLDLLGHARPQVHVAAEAII
jgi:hypothetical protein